MRRSIGNFRCLVAHALRRPVMRQQRQFRATKITDLKVILDESSPLPPGGYRSRNESRVADAGQAAVFLKGNVSLRFSSVSLSFNVTKHTIPPSFQSFSHFFLSYFTSFLNSVKRCCSFFKILLPCLRQSGAGTGYLTASPGAHRIQAVNTNYRQFKR